MKAFCRLDQIEIGAETGIVGIRLVKRITSDKGELISYSYHRATIPPGINPEIMFVEVNRHLKRMGFEAVPADDILKVKEAINRPEVSKLRATKYAELKKAEAEAILAEAQRHKKRVAASKKAAKKAKTTKH